MRSFLQMVAAAAIGVLIGSSGVGAIAAAIPLLTGPQDVSQLRNILNSLISTINADLTSYLTFAQANELGEMAFTTGNTFAPNGTVATGLTSVGPVGSHTTVQKWLTVVDNTGAILYVPLF